jgi:hypothetical protein
VVERKAVVGCHQTVRCPAAQVSPWLGFMSVLGRVVFCAMPSNSPFAREWTIDPTVDFLNHGCYGCCPRAVLDRQA